MRDISEPDKTGVQRRTAGPLTIGDCVARPHAADGSIAFYNQVHRHHWRVG